MCQWVLVAIIENARAPPTRLATCKDNEKTKLLFRRLKMLKVLLISQIGAIYLNKAIWRSLSNDVVGTFEDFIFYNFFSPFYHLTIGGVF